MRLPYIFKTLFGFLLLTIHCTVFADTSRDDPIVGHSEGNHRLDCTIISPGGPGKNRRDLTLLSVGRTAGDKAMFLATARLNIM